MGECNVNSYNANTPAAHNHSNYTFMLAQSVSDVWMVNTQYTWPLKMYKYRTHRVCITRNTNPRINFKVIHVENKYGLTTAWKLLKLYWPQSVVSSIFPPQTIHFFFVVDFFFWSVLLLLLVFKLSITPWAQIPIYIYYYMQCCQCIGFELESSIYVDI